VAPKQEPIDPRAGARRQRLAQRVFRDIVDAFKRELFDFVIILRADRTMNIQQHIQAKKTKQTPREMKTIYFWQLHQKRFYDDFDPSPI
jgi:hypothetical protein